MLFGDAADGAWYFDLIRKGEDVSPIRETLIFRRQVTEGLAAIETLAARGSGIADAVAIARDRLSGMFADVGGVGS